MSAARMAANLREAFELPGISDIQRNQLNGVWAQISTTPVPKASATIPLGHPYRQSSAREHREASRVVVMRLQKTLGIALLPPLLTASMR